MLHNLFKRTNRQPDPPASPFRLNAIVLMYHHIGQVHASDPWNMCVDRAAFEEQLHLLSSDYEVRPLMDLLEPAEHVSGKPMICLSFDDGYLEHYTEVFPLLQRYRLPATFFISSGYLAGGPHQARICWWEVVDHVFLDHDPIPDLKGILPGPDVFDEQARMSLLVTPQVNDDMFAYHAWHMRMKVNSNRQDKWAKALLKKCGHTTDILPAMLTEAHVREMAQSPYVTIGGHGFYHQILGLLPRRKQWKEIIENKQHLEELIGKPVEVFAYPHGHYNELTPELVKKAGYKLACTTAAELDNPGITAHEIPRLWARSWTAEELHLLLEKLFQQIQAAHAS
ncbi:polysaccharide deacetylase family protein [Thermoflavifilum thermophilum]|uniref:Polysaccharide deacetylase n=1 Tax=Thermoflavifilum thermophilum TaxID=1393122 RepID=A0A1I7NBK8_9BACT|nr:polysaccharide deacetylase family protein [Thermoflavifilum thermophilum]SFV32050.1 Polysaccharide deacetylase [Thermoflavifilum thermophilum]